MRHPRQLAELPEAPRPGSGPLGGGLGGGGAANKAEHSQNASIAKIATKVVNAAYNAFGSGLHEALLLSGCLILAGAVVAALTIHRKPGETFEI